VQYELEEEHFVRFHSFNLAYLPLIGLLIDI